MSRVIYVHGFLSSSGSMKAQQTASWLSDNRPDVAYSCPDLSSYPELALARLEAELKKTSSQNTFLIGSSLGGFWASHFVEIGLANKAVLINPAVSPHTRFADLVGQELTHYYSDETVCLSHNDIEILASCEQERILKPDKHWLLAQTGDEVLDYRLAEKRYTRCRQTIETGGNHGFENYARLLPDIIEFFDI